MDVLADLIVNLSITLDLKESVQQESDPIKQKALQILIDSNDVINDIKSVSAFMICSINRCQDYAKAQEGVKLVPNYTTIDVKEAICEAVNVFGKPLFGDRVVISPFPEELCSHVVTDGQWLQENIMCLLSNAVKFSPNEAITVTLSITTPATAGEDGELQNEDSINSAKSRCSVAPRTFILVEIEDHGVGIPDEKKSKLFQAFNQAQSHAGGTGLGLYSLAQRVTALRGSYGVSNRHDHTSGSLFWFTFPYLPDNITSEFISTESVITSEMLKRRLSNIDSSAPSTPTARAESGSISSMPTENESYSNFNVLLVDDSELILKMLSKQLKKNQMNVFTAMNGLDALHALETSGPFDVMVIDLHMPVLDGLETIRRIRDQEAEDDEGHNKKHQIIIGCSANGDTATVMETLTNGADGFITKPFTFENFQRKLSKLGLNKPPPAPLAM